MPDAMRFRRATVEHMFGTLKDGRSHFKTTTLEKVRIEMSLQVLAHTLKRMIQILGRGPLMQQCGLEKARVGSHQHNRLPRPDVRILSLPIKRDACVTASASLRR